MKTITLVALLSIAAFAVDYSTMSVTELQALRGNIPVADRAAFQSAMQTKVQAMSVADRQALQNSMIQNQGSMGSQMHSGQNMGSNQSFMKAQQGSMGSSLQAGPTMSSHQGGMGNGRAH